MQTYKITSKYNNLINLKVTPGHFATSSSHINYFIDLTTLKARCSEAKAVAKSMASDYIASTIVDTIICMDGTEVIGAYLADELTASGIMSMNAHGTIYIIEPDQNSMGQLTFKDNVIPMVNKKNVLLLLAGQKDAFMKNAEVAGDTDAFDRLAESLNKFAGGSRGDFNIIEP